jgi:ankyrin repeat protein
MKSIIVSIVAAVVLVGCGDSQQSAPAPEPPTAKAPAISIVDAAYKGKIEAVKQHLAAGTGVNAKDDLTGLTPLHQTARGVVRPGAGRLGDPLRPKLRYEGHKEIAELLIEKGADVNARDDIGYTPLDHTIGHDENEIADLLRKHGGKHGTIHTAAKAGDAEAVKEFLAAGADVNVKGGSEWTPLHEATRGGRKGIVKLLIAKGADVNAKDWRGRTPLDFAIIKRQSEIADLLRKHGGKTAEELKAEGK